ncbi:MAG TPA: iron-sulfur cluster repair di-iron protein [Cyclobacteriaceae bacterium]|nr:iron-sulfur cluster repair di-iron protein [Cyclobacteriaceae bacterium]
METTIGELTVADVAMKYPQSIGILNRYFIDYCCGGTKSFTEACVAAGQDSDTVWDEIMTTRSGGAAVDFEKWTAGLLADYIVEQHHHYVKEAIPVLTALLDKVSKVHGADHPELMEIKMKFQVLAEELLQHMFKEERVLFPAIKGKSELSLQAPVKVMEEEHELAGNLIKEIRSLSGNYTCPDGVCITYRATYQQLQLFEEDLMQHVHLENNILFRKISHN